MLINNRSYKTIWYNKKLQAVQIIDQTKLPFYLDILTLKSLNDVVQAIKKMKVRGAPLIGATAAFGIYLAYRELRNKEHIEEAAQKIKNTRPTAVNLFWAVNKMMNKIDKSKNKNENENILLNEAEKICKDDIDACKQIGKNGYELIKKVSDGKKDTVNILTHCNAGWLATIDWGTATAPIYLAKRNNIDIHIWVDETRPRNQGASLTSYELNNEGIKNTIIVDNAAGLLMQRKQIDLCIVGADRVTTAGHVANKVGTFLKAVIAKEFNIPFYVAIPFNTIDWNAVNYESIKIEERDGEELRKVKGIDDKGNIKTVLIYPNDSIVYNPSFDITPNKFINAFITNKGIIKPNKRDILKMKND